MKPLSEQIKEFAQDMKYPDDEHMLFFSAEASKLENFIGAICERAERVQEGEDWDLVEFILRKKKKLPTYLHQNRK